MGWALLLLLVAMGGRSGGSRPGPEPEPEHDQGGGSAGDDTTTQDSAGLADMRAMLARSGLTVDWQTFLMATAGGESNWYSNVGLGPNNHPGRPPWLRPSKASANVQNAEARAAAKAYDRRASMFAGCTWPRDRYVFGSGGWFGMLPTNGLYAFRGTSLVCTDPWAVADPAWSIVMAVDFARRTMQNRNPTSWLALRTGWGWPARTNNAQQQDKVMNKRRGLGYQLDRLGVPRSWAQGKPTPLPPRDPAGLYARLVQ